MSYFSLKKDLIFVKGFIGSEDKDVFVKSSPADVHGDLSVVVTDLQTSGVIRIQSAVQSDNAWVVTDMNGNNYTIFNEPKAPRHLFYGRLVTNVYEVGVIGRSFGTQKNYDVVFPDSNGEYTEVEKNIQDGALKYQFAGFPARNSGEIISSYIAKLWKEKDGHLHGLTVSGSHHYI